MVPLYFPPINKLGNSAFRKTCLDYGADFAFTEMVRVEKLLESDSVQIRKAKIDVNVISKTYIQIICEDIENVEKGVKSVYELNPDIIEINYNMGCPQSSLCSRELGGGIMRNPQKVFEVSRRLSDACSKFGIRPSVKIRLGIDRDNINILENVSMIGKAGIKKVYIHGRTLRDGYNKPATYQEIAEVKNRFPYMEIIANGDVCNFGSFQEICKTGCDGVLVGRAALENPQVFSFIKKNISVVNKSGVDMKFRKDVIFKYLTYAKAYDIEISQIKTNMSYLTRGVIGGSEFRKRVNDIQDIDSIMKIVDSM